MTDTSIITELLSAESIINDAPHTHATWQTGDVAHQGDIIFVGLKTVPNGAKTRTNRQLADGDTQGSRHILEGGKVYECDKVAIMKTIKTLTKATVQQQYIGPVFSTPATVTHPEHGDHVWPNKGVVVCVYQRNMDAEEREQRVRD